MRIRKKIRRIITKTFAIAEKNVRIQYRFKYVMILRYLTPIITILMPIIIFGSFFELNQAFGPWTQQNYIIFIFVGYNILLMRNMIIFIPRSLLQEKYWKTLPALITAPFNRFYLLIGYILSEFLGIIIPFSVVFIITSIFFPLSIPTLIVIILMFFGIGIVFSGVGLFLGVFAISNENLLYIFDFIVRLILWLSCVTYPFQIFPTFVQTIIYLNPIYYLIDIVRLTWLENNIILSAISYPIHVSVFAISLIIFPIVCVFMFNVIYKKLGISGY